MCTKKLHTVFIGYSNLKKSFNAMHSTVAKNVSNFMEITKYLEILRRNICTYALKFCKKIAHNFIGCSMQCDQNVSNFLKISQYFEILQRRIINKYVSKFGKIKLAHNFNRVFKSEEIVLYLLHFTCFYILTNYT